MAGLGGMDEVAGRAGGGEGGGDLAPDMARLAHAGDDDVAAGGFDDIGGRVEGFTQFAAQRLLDGFQAALFDFQGANGALTSRGDPSCVWSRWRGRLREGRFQHVILRSCGWLGTWFGMAAGPGCGVRP